MIMMIALVMSVMPVRDRDVDEGEHQRVRHDVRPRASDRASWASVHVDTARVTL